MPEIFRKHYSYGETIPALQTHVGMTCDLYEVPDKPSSNGAPYIKAIFTATAGPMKSAPMILEPLQDNDSKVVHLTNIPVPIPSVGTVDLSLIFDLVNYRWTPTTEQARDSGLVTFDLRMRAAFSLLGKSYTLQLDQRPCALTLTRPLSTRQYVPSGTISDGSSDIGRREAQSISGSYAPPDERFTPASVINGTVESVAGQLDMEERLRQLSTKALIRQ